MHSCVHYKEGGLKRVKCFVQGDKPSSEDFSLMSDFFFSLHHEYDLSLNVSFLCSNCTWK